MKNSIAPLAAFKALPPHAKFAFFIWLALVVMGATQATNWSTDNYSDQFIFDEMKALLAGQHRYGIVGNTHYPNGPGYVLLPFMAAGVSELRTLRWVPFAFAVAALSFFMFAILKSKLSSRAQWVVLVLWSLLAFLPAFVYWQGALHEHSYAMSLSLASLAIALWPQAPHSKAPALQTSQRQTARGPLFWLTLCFAIGYCAGWMGFDFLPVHLLSFFAVSLVAHGFWGRTFTQSVATFAGAIAAIFSHLLQNTLYFGSWRGAWNDLIGSATTYAGIQSAAQSMSPEYYQGIATSISEKGKDTHVFSVLSGFTHSFATDWASPLWCALFALVFFAAPLVLIGRRSHGRMSHGVTLWLGKLAPGAALSIAACYAWPALMPNHAVFHFHFLPRHFIVGLLALSLVSGLALDASNALDIDDNVKT